MYSEGMSVMNKAVANKIPPAPIVFIDSNYIREVAERFEFTPEKGYKVKRTVPMDGERKYMIVDDEGKYVFVSPNHCVQIN